MRFNPCEYVYAVKRVIYHFPNAFYEDESKFIGLNNFENSQSIGFKDICKACGKKIVLVYCEAPKERYFTDRIKLTEWI